MRALQSKSSSYDIFNELCMWLAWVNFLQSTLAGPKEFETLWGVEITDFDDLLELTQMEIFMWTSFLRSE